jgi:spermidine synthase
MDQSRLPRWLVILVVSLAGLLLEVAYTRVISYKLWYYYTYLVIGLSLLGIGTGGVVVAISRRVQRATTGGVVALFALAGAASIPIGYALVANLRIDTVRIWDYGTASSLRNLAVLVFICFLIFATFISIGVIVSVLLGRAGERVGRIYFADLIGAGLGCLLAIPLIARIGPPDVIIVAAVLLGFVGVASVARPSAAVLAAAGAVLVAVGIVAVTTDAVPDVYTEATKLGGPHATYSEWGPVFRVDVAQLGEDADNALLLHDGTYGAGIHRWDGKVSSLERYAQDPRAVPFEVLGAPPRRELIIGSAGGNEILASLWFRAPRIEAVELNPVTNGLLRGRYADFTGHLARRKELSLHTGDGRSYLARSNRKYDLIWYVAPDSYAANNAASSGAFVLSESYLYTSQMIADSLRHLTDRGIMVVQFGELDLEHAPNRTGRYVVTARRGLERIGVRDAGRHLAVAGFFSGSVGDLSTIVVKRTPFTAEESAAFRRVATTLPNVRPIHVPGDAPGESLVSRLAAVAPERLGAVESSYPRDLSAVSDDKPFFWHFTPFSTVIRHLAQPIHVSDPEVSIGERVLVLLLAISVLYAAAFLLLPFVAVRSEWRALPRKGVSAVYFGALGLGFMMFEITMIQRLVRFLGYPTYSLTVTLASVLVFAGLGSLLSRRVVGARLALPALVAALAALTVFYQTGLDPLLDRAQSGALGVRVLLALVVLAPLGLVLGMFMPLGLGRVFEMTPHGQEYVAWSWAVNGFFSVIGSVLTTMLSMTFGFRAVQNLAVVVYVVAAVAFAALARPAGTPKIERVTVLP